MAQAAEGHSYGKGLDSSERSTDEVEKPQSGYTPGAMTIGGFLVQASSLLLGVCG